MKHVWQVTRLHLNKPAMFFANPVYVVLAVVVLTAFNVFILQRGGLDPGSPDYEQQARWNLGVIIALPGFLIYYGVQATATTYPFALALGATRRAHVLGTALGNTLLSVYVAVLALGFLGIERATGHWFFNLHALDVNVLGSGNALRLLVTLFCVTLCATSLGGFLGAAWVRFGARGPVVVSFTLGLALVILLLIFIPYAEDIVRAITRPILTLIGLGFAALMVGGTWLALRRASVR